MTNARPLSRRAQFTGRQPISELMRLALARPELISLAAGFVDFDLERIHPAWGDLVLLLPVEVEGAHMTGA